MHFICNVSYCLTDLNNIVIIIFQIKTTAENIGSLDIGCKLTLSNIKLTQTFKCTVNELYNALTIKEVRFHKEYVNLEQFF